MDAKTPAPLDQRPNAKILMWKRVALIPILNERRQRYNILK
jgi:hypothetical protein